MTETPIVCSYHFFSLASIPEYPHTVYSTAYTEGWRTTRDKLFSMDGEPVWICPSCHRWLFFKRRDGLLADIEAQHEKRESEIWNIYRRASRDEGVRSFREVCRAIDKLREEMDIGG